MCKETITVSGVNDARSAYEVESYLSGLHSVRDVQCDAIEQRLEVEYDESELSHERLLDEIEHAGCVPSERINGVIDRLKTRLRA